MYHSGMSCVKVLKIVVCVCAEACCSFYLSKYERFRTHDAKKRFALVTEYVKVGISYEQEQAYCVVGTAVSKVSNCTCLSQSLCIWFTYRPVIVKYLVCDISLTGYKCSTSTEIFTLNFMLKIGFCNLRVVPCINDI